ncbi:hypothetical protein E3N88_07508 [Mikania micrantha]|uniref:Uncharacterized protein n=1 Tax=Mikania micrantha TaxID=192012 RepID=A0A5N6PTQ2_9ASTR|nr:hypothetical protein E3N88_07461 [Mikania micrantha]KAD6796612.1 hypothetical protein E3N88_07508 [Mikania micrantha]
MRRGYLNDSGLGLGLSNIHRIRPEWEEKMRPVLSDDSSSSPAMTSDNDGLSPAMTDDGSYQVTATPSPQQT